MRASTRFSDAIHILCFLKVYEEARITSDLLSSSIGDGPHPLFNVNPDTNPQCKVGGHIQPILAEVYQEAQAAAMIRFNNVTVADIVDQINLKLHQEKLQD